jgi:hypothetical protein
VVAFSLSVISKEPTHDTIRSTHRRTNLGHEISLQKGRWDAH